MCSVKERERVKPQRQESTLKEPLLRVRTGKAGAVTAPGLDGGMEAFQLSFQH